MRGDVIVGVDILPGEAPGSAREPRYAVVVLEGDEVRLRREGVSLGGLKRLLRRLRPSILAVDSVSEIASDKEELVEFLSEFDFPLKVVQVTMVRGEERSLEELAEELGLHRGKLSPLEAAEVAAYLASLRVGSYVEVFEEETRITVSRGRSLGSGGMSTERYRRNIQSLILRVTREIQEALDKKGFDYDLFLRRGDHGLRSSTFIVYAPRERLYGVVRPMRGHDVQVSIRPVVKSEVEFVPMTAPSKRAMRELPQRYLMVGVDPGTVTGVAAISLSGRPVVVFSKRELSRSQLIRVLSSYGRVVLVATDVTPPPLYVKKLAASLNAVLYVPPYALSVEEKRRLVQEYCERSGGLRVLNTHQRDALAAVLKAYNSFKPKFSKLERCVREAGLQVPLSEAKAMLLRGKTIKEIVSELSRRLKPKEEVRGLPRRGDIESYVKGLKSRIAALEASLREAERERRELEAKVRELEVELLEARRRMVRLLRGAEVEVLKDRRVAALLESVEGLRRRVSQLEGELEEARRAAEEWRQLAVGALRGEVVQLVPLRSLTPSSVAQVGELRDRIVYVERASYCDPRAAEGLARGGVAGVVASEQALGHLRGPLEELGVPVVSSADVGVREVGGLVVADAARLREALERERRRAAEKRERRVRAMLEKIFEEYRAMRARELQG